MDTPVQDRPVITMDSVTSSQLHGYGYDAATQTLAVQFHNKAKDGPGSVYHYANFTPADWYLFNQAESKGSHFKKHIRTQSAKFPYVQIS